MSNSVPQTSLSADVISYVRYQLRGRRGLIVAAAALGIPALWIGWPWLVVAGIAPLLIALAPCAIMCTLGYCAMRTGANENRGEASGSNLNSGESSCCSKSQSADNTVVSLTTNKSADRSTQLAAVAQPLRASVNSVEDESQARAEDAGQPRETIKQEKETLR